METKYITLIEAADMLGKSDVMVRIYARAGCFRTAVKLGGTQWRVERSEIEGILSGDIVVDFRRAKENI